MWVPIPLILGITRADRVSASVIELKNSKCQLSILLNKLQSFNENKTAILFISITYDARHLLKLKHIFIYY